MDTTIKLPLAEKTSLRDWDFSLSLEPFSEAKLDANSLLKEGAKNQIIIIDGEIKIKELEEGIYIENNAGLSSARVENSLLDANFNNKNSEIKVIIEKNKIISEPLYITYFAETKSLVHQTQIILEEGAEAEIVESFGGSIAANSNIIRNAKLKSNSKLNSTVVNSLDGEKIIYYHSFSEIEADAKLRHTNLILNNSSMVFEDYSYTIGRGSEADVSTVSIASKNQKQNITIRTENLAPHSIGNIVNYGIVKDKAHLACNCIGKIHTGMNGVDNQQETRMLNLSLLAEAVANPFLLIDEGDITAGHAASIGQLNEEQVYYLMSRGMSRLQSEKLIASGFLTPFVDNSIKNEEFKNQLLKIIESRLS